MENFNELLSTLTDNQLSIVSGLNKFKKTADDTYLTKVNPSGTGKLQITNILATNNISGNIVYANGKQCLTEHQSLANYYNKSEVNTISSTLSSKIPTKTSQLTNDSGFLTSHQSLSNYYTKTETTNTFLTKANPTGTGTLSIPTVSTTTVTATTITLNGVADQSLLIYNNGKITALAKPTTPSVLTFDGTNYVWVAYANCTE